jgi:hypothetical protein
VPSQSGEAQAAVPVGAGTVAVTSSSPGHKAKHAKFTTNRGPLAFSHLRSRPQSRPGHHLLVATGPASPEIRIQYHLG